MLVALPHDAALPLLDLRRKPGHVEVVQCLQPKLRIDAGAHRIGGADQEADLAGAHVAEQALLRLRLLVVLHEGDFGRRHAHADEPVPDPAIGREAAGLLDADRAEIGEDHLGSVEALSAYSTHSKRADFAGFILFNDEDQEIFSFGKYKGRTVEDVLKENPGYNAWIQNADFPLYTKKVLQAIKQRMSDPKKGVSDTDKLQALQQKFNLR